MRGGVLITSSWLRRWRKNKQELMNYIKTLCRNLSQTYLESFQDPEIEEPQMVVPGVCYP